MNDGGVRLLCLRNFLTQIQLTSCQVLSFSHLIFSPHLFLGFSRGEGLPTSQLLLNQSSRFMGQVLDKIQGKEWKRKQVTKITDRVFDHFKNDSGRASLTFEELYIAVLLVFNDINKHLPGPHFDPPSKEQIRAMMQVHDINLDGELDREEFAKFIQELSADTLSTISQGLIITLAVAPTVALLTKRATEGVPGVGKVVQKLPNAVYASLVTLAIMMFQRSGQAIE